MFYRIISLVIICAFVTIFTSASFAKDSVKVDAKIPHDLNLKDQTGTEQNFSKLSGKKGIVLVFIRSASWCPFCQKQLIELNKNNKKFNDLGYKIISVSYDSVSGFEKFVTKHKLKLKLLSDPRSESIRAFGILDKSKAMGTRSYGIPHPGVYIISKDKKVQAKFFKDEYKDRPSIEELIAKIKKLNPPPVKRRPVVQYKSLDDMGEDPIDPVLDIIDTPVEDLAPVLPPAVQ